MFAVDFLFRHGPRGFLYYLGAKFRRLWSRAPVELRIEAVDGAIQIITPTPARAMIHQWLFAVGDVDVPSPAVLDAETLLKTIPTDIPPVRLEDAVSEFWAEILDGAGLRRETDALAALHLGSARGLRTVVCELDRSGGALRARSMTPFQWRMLGLRRRLQGWRRRRANLT